MEKHFEIFPVLKTKRLVLKPIELTDAQAIFEMRANKHVNEFIARPKMETVEAAQSLVEATRKKYAEKQAIAWAGILRDYNKIIGTCGFNNFDFANKHAEIGGEMATDYWGKGIAQEAFEAIIKFGQNELDLQTIEAKVSPKNRSAIALLTSYGFIKEAHFKNRIFFEGQFLDMAVYTLHK
jgi:[ribosomal protein S5]-alanine N-acetyltransferase